MTSATNQIRFSLTCLTLPLLACSSITGCRLHDQIETVANARAIGSVVNEINLQQEANADASKYTIYMHEFEINTPSVADLDANPGLGMPNSEQRGYRLTSAGHDHVREIARQLLIAEQECRGGPPPTIPVVVERSNTSTLANTMYQYPVHFNSELDAVRRQMVVSVLQEMGVHWADSSVVVAPALATGLSATESATAYQKATGVGGQSGSRSGTGSGSSSGTSGSSYVQ